MFLRLAGNFHGFEGLSAIGLTIDFPLGLKIII